MCRDGNGTGRRRTEKEESGRPTVAARKGVATTGTGRRTRTPTCTAWPLQEAAVQQHRRPWRLPVHGGQRERVEGEEGEWRMGER
jgi:hypothetical protein